MRSLLKTVFMLCALILTFGCSESPESLSPKPAEVQQSAPEFIRADTHEAFFDQYRRDLTSENFLPDALVKELEGSTRIAQPACGTIPFATWVR